MLFPTGSKLSPTINNQARALEKYINPEHQNLLADMRSITNFDEYKKAVKLIISQKEVNYYHDNEGRMDVLNISYKTSPDDMIVNCDTYSPHKSPAVNAFCEQQGKKFRTMLRGQIPSLTNRPL